MITSIYEDDVLKVDIDVEIVAVHLSVEVTSVVDQVGNASAVSVTTHQTAISEPHQSLHCKMNTQNMKRLIS